MVKDCYQGCPCPVPMGRQVQPRVDPSCISGAICVVPRMQSNHGRSAENQIQKHRLLPHKYWQLLGT
ncbi:MAG: hypothetical protein CMP47_10650 [Rickettsiales bacterium]|nr:hypothetical protein [Rickettsiales bacterium]